MTWKSLSLSGWGRWRPGTAQVCRPERLRDLTQAVAVVEDGGIVARGLGRSYGDQAVNSGGRVVLTQRLDRMESFDPDTGLLVAEAGVTFADVMRTFLPRGFLVPVTPGTAFVTLGGAVANDVHGKNHDRAGSFGDHVEWFDLLVPAGDEVRCSTAENAELFAATIGGCGLTGVIVRVAVRLHAVPSSRLVLHEARIPDLDAFFDAFEQVRDSATFSVGWIDALARGKALGRGILETAEIAQDDGRRVRPRKKRTLPFALVGLALNRLTVALFNALYWRRVPRAGRERVVAADRFFYPLDAVRDWNRIYGKRGFHQFQCVIPDANARGGIRRLLEEASGAGAASFLAVLKTLGGEGRGHLSFPLRGYTLALDFPHRKGTEALLARLETITLDHGGRVYLAKDQTLSRAGFARMYPRLRQFRAVLRAVDRDGRIQSDMARRLDIRGDTP